MAKRDLTVLHIGAGRYAPRDRSHGTFAIWRELAKGFQRYAVVGRSTLPRADLMQDGDLTVHLLPSLARSEAEFLVTQFAALSIVRRIKPDVIVAQCPVLGGLAGLAIGAPVLMELHGAHYFAPRRLDRNSVIRALAHHSLPRATAIRALSAGMKTQLIERYGAQLAGRTTVLPPRVDLTVFNEPRADWSIVDRLPRAMMVGALNGNKGQARFLNAVFSAGLDLEVWLAGEGPERDACEAIVDRFGARDKVRFMGQVTQPQLASLLPQADVLVQYSRTEGAPRAILEGMAAGLPVVSTDVGFIKDILPGGGEALLLGPDPDAEVAPLLQSLFSDERLRTRLGGAGRAHVERRFEAKVVFEQYRELIARTARG